MLPLLKNIFCSHDLITELKSKKREWPTINL